MAINPTRIGTASFVIAILVGLVLWTLRDTSEAAHKQTAPAPTSESQLREQLTSSPALPETVKFKNPFDKHEIFEFPAGTTDEAAKAAVADILMKRALERKDEVYAHLPKRKRHVLASN